MLFTKSTSILSHFFYEILFSEHRFELAIQLGDLKEAHKLAVEAQSEHKWKQLAELATAKSEFVLAQECLHRAQDFGGLLLLATSSGNKIFKICSHFKTVA